MISLLGAPHTGVQALALALQERLDPAQVCVIFGPPNDPSASKAASPSAQSNPQNAPVVELRPAMLTLLMGLDLPCPTGERLAQEAADSQLRSALECANTAYKVVYGQGDARIQHALNAIKKVAFSALLTSATTGFNSEIAPPNKRLHTWECAKCSDPECEFRLFTRLTN
ncbi:MAG: hypothetical protein K2Q97_17670, partial [Burkholderiaceae bacterium]|nr:hypothetical protein [Burkholderiaceae bacterium]